MKRWSKQNRITWRTLNNDNFTVIVKSLGGSIDVVIPGVEPEGLVRPRLDSRFKHTRCFAVDGTSWNLKFITNVNTSKIFLKLSSINISFYFHFI